MKSLKILKDETLLFLEREIDNKVSNFELITNFLNLYFLKFEDINNMTVSEAESKISTYIVKPYKIIIEEEKVIQKDNVIQKEKDNSYFIDFLLIACFFTLMFFLCRK